MRGARAGLYIHPDLVDDLALWALGHIMSFVKKDLCHYIFYHRGSGWAILKAGRFPEADCWIEVPPDPRLVRP